MYAYNVALMIKPSSQFQIAYSANYIYVAIIWLV